jgi:hypothetical protein
MCVTYGVEHKTAVSVESDLPFVLMGFVLILWGLIYVKVKVDVKEPGPGIKFKKKGENEEWRRCVPDICACTAKTARRKTLQPKGIPIGRGRVIEWGDFL